MVTGATAVNIINTNFLNYYTKNGKLSTFKI